MQIAIAWIARIARDISAGNNFLVSEMSLYDISNGAPDIFQPRRPGRMAHFKTNVIFGGANSLSRAIGVGIDQAEKIWRTLSHVEEPLTL